MGQADAERVFGRMRKMIEECPKDWVTVTRRTDGSWEASLTYAPSVFEVSSVSKNDAIGALVSRMWSVRSIGGAS